MKLAIGAVLILALGTAIAHAQVSVAIAPRIGVSIPDDRLGASSFAGIETDIVLPQGLSIGLNFSLAAPDHHGQASSALLPMAQLFEMRQTELVVGPIFSYRRSLDDDTQLRVGGGPLVRKLWVDETTTTAMFRSDNTQLGLEGLIAIERRAGVGSIVADVRLLGAWTPPACANIEACSAQQATNLTGTDHTSLVGELSIGYEIEFGSTPRRRHQHQSELREIEQHAHESAEPNGANVALYHQGVAAAAREECAVVRTVASQLQTVDAQLFSSFIRDVGVASCLP